MTRRARVQQQPAYLLHHRPYRDTSRILELYTEAHGRVSLFARGARGGKNGWSALLRPFTPLLVSYTGDASGDAGNLTGVEAAPGPTVLPPARVLSGFYLNELMLKLLPRAEPQPELYAVYAGALIELAGAADEARTLRLFEKRLLDALGYGVDYTHIEATGERVREDAYYRVRPERGVEAEADGAGGAHVYLGGHLLAVAAEELSDPAALGAARGLLQAALAGPLDGRALGSRTVARALRDLGKERNDVPLSGRQP